MRTAGNILWLVLAGIWLAIGYVIAGILNFVIIIGIPLGIQAFKLAGYALWPFGRAVIRKPHTTSRYRPWGMWPGSSSEAGS